MRDLSEATRGVPAEPEYTRTPGDVTVLVNQSVGRWHYTVWRGMRRVAWGIGETEDSARAAAEAQLAEVVR